MSKPATTVKSTMSTMYYELYAMGRVLGYLKCFKR